MTQDQASKLPFDEELLRRNLDELETSFTAMDWFLKQVLSRLVPRAATHPRNEFAWRDVQAALHLLKLGIRSLTLIPFREAEVQEHVDALIAKRSEQIEGLVSIVEDVRQKIGN
jgi:hypothetical protein